MQEGSFVLLKSKAFSRPFDNPERLGCSVRFFLYMEGFWMSLITKGLLGRTKGPEWAVKPPLNKAKGATGVTQQPPLKKPIVVLDE